MGLLEKAMRLREGRRPPGSGLFGRALRLARDEDTPVTPPAGRRPGLFERARQLRESAQAGGLLGRALKMRTEPSPAVSPAAPTEPDAAVAKPASAQPVAGPSGPPVRPEQPTEEVQSPADRLRPISADEASRLLFDSGDNQEEIHPPSFEPESAFADESPYEAPAPESFPELPALDLSFSEQSSPDTDPALLEEAPEAMPDPFRQWEEEAGREAERHTRDLLGLDEEHIPIGGGDAITTMPVETHIASQKRIDNYLSLFELNRELNAIDQVEDFWDSVVYSILGQIGARTVVIFAAKSAVGESFYAVASSGVSVSEDWVLNKDDLLTQAMGQSEEIRYAGEFLNSRSGISSKERQILTDSRAALIVPLKHGEQYDGMILVGPPLESVDYVIDDLEFLKLLSGTLMSSLRRIMSVSRHVEETALLERENALHRILASMTAAAQTRKTVDEVYDLLLEFYQKELGVESLSLVLLDPPEQEYRIFAGNRISPASLQRFHLPVGTSELIGTVSNLSGIYDLVEFRRHPEIVANYAGDDLALMQKYIVLPLINLNWLVGFLTVHRMNRPWTELERDIALNAANQVAAIMANCIILKERETLFRDPFSPLEKRLERELQKAMEFHSFLSIVVLNVRNLKKLLGANGMPAMTEFFLALSRTVSRNLFATDYMTRMGAGRFVLLLPGRGRAEAGIFSERLQIELRQTPLLRGSALAPAYDCEVINFPDDADSMQKLIALLDR